MRLELEDLSVSYGDVVVVRDCSMTVEPGAVMALLGRNGAGKTSLLNAAIGLVPARTGSVRLDGIDVTGRPTSARVRAGLSLVQEGKRTFKGLTVDENLILGAYSRRLNRKELGAYLDEIYAQVPMIAAKRHEPAGSLSGGQQQMLAIGQALGAQPSILLLDEPSAGLAPSIVGDVFDLVGSLRAAGMGILLVEQSVDFALAIADQITVMEVGRVVLRCPADAPSARQRIADAYMGHSQEAVAHALLDESTLGTAAG